VYRLESDVEVGDVTLPRGAWWIPGGEASRGDLEALARATAVDVHAVASAPTAAALRLRPLRIGLVDEYGGSMPSGWTRLILEDFDFEFEQVFAPRLNRGDLAADYDVLLFADMNVGGGWGSDGGAGEGWPEDIRREYGHMLGRIDGQTTVPAIADFVRGGGVVVAWGASASLATALDLPFRDALVDEQGERLGSEDFFVPGSLLRVELDGDSPVTAGMGGSVDVLFSRNPVLELASGASGVSVVGRFAADDVLSSGWAWGREHVEGKPAFFEADLGQGKVFVFTPEITFRSQSHAAFPLLFNAMYHGTATRASTR
jgi:hypothetical protein